MPDLLAKASSWMAGKFRTSASQDVTYIDDKEKVTLKAVVGQPEVSQVTKGRVGQKLEHRAFGIFPSDLVLNGVQREPARGRIIELLEHGKRKQYEVVSFDDEPVFRDHDPYGDMLRVNTVLKDDKIDA